MNDFNLQVKFRGNIYHDQPIMSLKFIYFLICFN